MNNLKAFLKISAVLWVIWGLVHMFAGVMTVGGVFGGDLSVPIAGIADAVNIDTLKMDYPEALGGILAQHGFNLLWFGLITTIAAFYIWKGNVQAVWWAAIVGGLADLGYFLFIDLGGFNNFVPGTVMTLISASAIILSMYAIYARKEA
ncbi:MAG: hypothetical protein AAFY48_12745 [Bacteroidota bacterium]